jgi:Fe-S cluster assembly ATPase SufC
MAKVLRIDNLRVAIEDKEILRGVTLGKAKSTR